jgi:hypothetical protein
MIDRKKEVKTAAADAGGCSFSLSPLFRCHAGVEEDGFCVEYVCTIWSGPC